MQVTAVGVAEAGDQRLLGQRRELADGEHTESFETPARRRAHSPQPLDAERVQELELGPGRDHEHPVGLGEVAGELGDELGRAHSHRRRETGLGAHAFADRRSHLDATSEVAARATDVEEGLVERDRLHQRRERLQDSHHRTARVAVRVEAGREEHTVGAGTARACHRHRGVHAEPAGLVARRGDHAARAETADDHRASAHRGVGELLDRRVERVEVDVQDRRVGHVARTAWSSSRRLPKMSYA